jgi:3-methyladenine DNA glycosylase AlkD
MANVNNWDLVDGSAEFIVGPYLEDRPEKLTVLTRLADSKSIWERRIAMLATFAYIKKGKPETALVIAEQLLYDQHDLIQKAVGWMLREIGKRVDRAPLLAFLDKYAGTMPRTTLRYAVEHLPTEQRTHYMGLKGVQ